MKVLFVCLGNICRSSTAQTIMQQLLDKHDLHPHIQVDSAGILNYHQGEAADPRMRAHAARRGYDITHLSRPVTARDFYDFDLILGMDEGNIDDLHDRCPSPALEHKIGRMTDYCRQNLADHVPDPYYGGAQGFEHVLDLLEDACEGLLEKLREEKAIQTHS